MNTAQLTHVSVSVPVRLQCVDLSVCSKFVSCSTHAFPSLDLVSLTDSCVEKE